MGENREINFLITGDISRFLATSQEVCRFGVVGRAGPYKTEEKVLLHYRDIPHAFWPQRRKFDASVYLGSWKPYGRQMEKYFCYW